MLNSRKMVRSSKIDSIGMIADYLKNYINLAKEVNGSFEMNSLNIELISMCGSKYNIVLNCYAGNLVNTCLSRVKFYGSKRTNHYEELKRYDIETIRKYDNDEIQKLCLEIIKDNLNYCFEKNKLELKVIKPKVK